MFSVVSVHYVTITHDALDLTIQGSPKPCPLLDMGSHCAGTPSANAMPPSPLDMDLTVQGPLPPHPHPDPSRSAQTCSSLFNLDLTVQGHWLQLLPSSSSQACSKLFIMKHIHLASKRFASYQNAFCLENTVAVRTQIATAAIPLQGSKLKCGK